MSSKTLIFDFASGRVTPAADHPAGVEVAAAALQGRPERLEPAAHTGPATASGAIRPA